MTEYRRSRVAGGTYFFTWVTHHRKPIFAAEPAINVLRQAVKAVQFASPFTINAWVVLPDHIHCVLTLPAGDDNYSKRIGQIKSRFSASAGSEFHSPDTNSISRRKKREATIWQRRFWEHRIRDEHDYQKHMDYVHFNPVKHGLVKQVKDWPFSTFHKYCELGVYSSDWGGDGAAVDEDFGE